MKNPAECTTCKNPKATLRCGLCHGPICKGCAEFVPEESFAFLTKIPAELSHAIYCIPCYNEKIAPALDSYNEIMERAKNVFVYSKSQGKETRLMKSTEEPLKVADCLDREETLLRLAFLAAQANFNALIGVEIISKKSTKTTTYKTISWSGTGIPTVLDAEKMNRRY